MVNCFQIPFRSFKEANLRYCLQSSIDLLKEREVLDRKTMFSRFTHLKVYYYYKKHFEMISQNFLLFLKYLSLPFYNLFKALFDIFFLAAQGGYFLFLRQYCQVSFASINQAQDYRSAIFISKFELAVPTNLIVLISCSKLTS